VRILLAGSIVWLGWLAFLCKYFDLSHKSWLNHIMDQSSLLIPNSFQQSAAEMPWDCRLLLDNLNKLIIQICSMVVSNHREWQKGKRRKQHCLTVSFLLLLWNYYYKTTYHCRIIRWWEKGSMQHLWSIAWKQQQMDPGRKLELSLKFSHSHCMSSCAKHGRTTTVG
jgi:hypothetical protein